MYIIVVFVIVIIVTVVVIVVIIIVIVAITLTMSYVPVYNDKKVILFDFVFDLLVPVQHNPVKVKVLAFQLQLWPNAPAREINNQTIWIVPDRADNPVLHLSHSCWVGPHCQLLSGHKWMQCCKNGIQPSRGIVEISRKNKKRSSAY